MNDKKSMKEIEKKRIEMIKNWKGRHFINMLDEMMRLQEKFGSRFIKFGNLTIPQKEKWTKEIVICLFSELSEILNWINWKHWKKKRYPINELEVKYELIDVMHFTLTLMLLYKMTPAEVFSMYIIKNRENHDRQERKY